MKLKKIIALSMCAMLLTGCATPKQSANSTENVTSDKQTEDSMSESETTTKKDDNTSQTTTKKEESTSEGSTTTKKDDTTSQTTTKKDNITTTSPTTTKKESSSSKEEETTTKGNDGSDTGDSSDGGNSSNTSSGWDMTTAQIVKDMGIGINLGNTFESCGTWINNSAVKNYETAWGSPEIKKEMIQGIAAEGFDSIRIPVAWSNMMGDNYTISSAYMTRVKEVVDWALDTGLYVIVNIHYDSGWWENFPTAKDECMKRYTRMWEQIATAFKDYDEKLIFESLNEEGCWDSVWNRYSGSDTGKSEAYGLLNEINQKFVDLVRSSGGNNGKRHLLIAGYATDIGLTCDSYYKMPTDSVGRCAVSVHYYTPVTYCLLTEDVLWGQAVTTWGTSSDIAELKANMKKMYDTFASKGVPVIIGEFGVPGMSNKEKDNVILYLKSVAEVAYDYGMCPMLWDTTSEYSYYNRYSCSMKDYTSLKEAFADIVE